MKKVYIVTSGTYSDYGINSVFQSEEKAQEFVDLMEKRSSYSDYDIEEYSVVDALDSYELKEYKVVDATLSVDGSFHVGSYSENTGELPIEDAETTQVFRHRYYSKSLGGVRIHRVLRDDALDEEKYRKICADILAEVKYLIDIDGRSLQDVIEIYEKGVKSE
ncbi:DUF7336 domain-containing protein [Priestia megaterium]|uniref:DUF7336 domain-containing protein n=1 Tax=Priestia megaterium TaxID=1404 RepID=UPI001D66F2AB|nr:hypothetical protein [Priestia megaterium]CAH0305815.1 hypothetical protein SRABI82_04724 [Priestia megaterium]